MNEIKVNLTLERDTVNTYRYKEDVGEAGSPPLLKVLYLQKWVVGKEAPKKIIVSIKPVE